MVSFKAFQIMSQLGACAAALDASRIARLLDMHDILARALPHTPQAAAANNVESISRNLLIVYRHAYGQARVMPPFESSDWKVR